MKDSSLHQRKRITDMMLSLLRDLSDIGTIVGGNAAETKVHNYTGLKLVESVLLTSLVQSLPNR